MRARVTKVVYMTENNELVVYLFGRFEDGTRMLRRVLGTEPYFYVRDNDVHLVEDHEKVVSIVDDDAVNVFDKPLRKVVTRFPFDVPDVREKVEFTYEADVKYKDRISIELGKYIDLEHDGLTMMKTIDYGTITPRAEGEPIRLRQWNIDIETEDSLDTERVPAPIVCLTVYDNFEDRYYCLTYLKNDPKIVNKILKREAKKFGTKSIKKFRIITCSSEREMFARFFKLRVELGPDIIKGWNVKDFDIEYIKNRSQKVMARETDFRAAVVFDLMESFKVLYNARRGTGRLKSKSLEYCSNLMLGYGKIKNPATCAQLVKTRGGVNQLLAYNIWDVVVANRLDEQEKVFEFYDSLAVESNSDVEDWDKPSVQIDMFILNYLYVNTKTKLISKQYMTKKEYQKAKMAKKHGGLVLKPFSGVARNVAVVDLSQEYPSIIRSLNISPETIVSEEEREELDNAEGWEESCNRGITGTLYWKEPRGVLPTILDYLSVMRNSMRDEMRKHDPETKEYKNYDMRQVAFKYFMNAFIGVLGARAFRLNNVDCFNDVTLGCQAHGKFIDEVLTKNGVKILYGDTDGREIVIGEKETAEWNIKKAQSLCKFLNKAFIKWAKENFNVDKCHFHIKFETLMEYFFQAGRVEKGRVIGKKRYAFLRYYDDGVYFGDRPIKDRLEIVGFEYVRRNASQITKDLQYFVFETLFTNEEWMNPVRNKVRETIDEILAGKHNENIGIVIGIQKSFYTKDEIHNRAKNFSNRFLGYDFRKGDTIAYYYGKIKGLPGTDVFAIHPEDKVPDTALIDYDKMISLTVKQPLEKIFEAMGYTWEQLIMGKKITRQKKVC